jgi:hypothetical protein
MKEAPRAGYPYWGAVMEGSMECKQQRHPLMQDMMTLIATAQNGEVASKLWRICDLARGEFLKIQGKEKTSLNEAPWHSTLDKPHSD